jgi:hypothetical protein
MDITVKLNIYYNITNEQELFRILWNAWKDCVYINDTNQYTRSIMT